jgi:hypothetical protein
VLINLSCSWIWMVSTQYFSSPLVRYAIRWSMYNLTFSSFVTLGNCEGSYIVFYFDAFCKTYVSTQYLTAGNQYNDNQVFTQCYNDASPASSAMASHKGFCSLGEDITVSTSSYVYK